MWVGDSIQSRANCPSLADQLNSCRFDILFHGQTANVFVERSKGKAKSDGPGDEIGGNVADVAVVGDEEGREVVGGEKEGDRRRDIGNDAHECRGGETIDEEIVTMHDNIDRGHNAGEQRCRCRGEAEREHAEHHAPEEEQCGDKETNEPNLGERAILCLASR